MSVAEICPNCSGLMDKESLGIGVECERCGHVIEMLSFCHDSDLTTLCATPISRESHLQHSFSNHRHVSGVVLASSTETFENPRKWRVTVDAAASSGYPLKHRYEKDTKKRSNRLFESPALPNIYSKGLCDILPSASSSVHPPSEKFGTWDTFLANRRKVCNSSGGFLRDIASECNDVFSRLSTVDGLCCGGESRVSTEVSTEEGVSSLSDSEKGFLQNREGVKTSVNAEEKQLLRLIKVPETIAGWKDKPVNRTYPGCFFRPNGALLSPRDSSSGRALRRNLQTSAMIKQFHRVFSIGNLGLVTEMIEQIASIRGRRNRKPCIVERLVAACCYIQGKLNTEPLTLKDVSAKVEFFSNNSRSISRWVNKVCQYLNIQHLPDTNFLDLMSRAIENLVALLEGSFLHEAYEETYPLRRPPESFARGSYGVNERSSMDANALLCSRFGSLPTISHEGNELQGLDGNLSDALDLFSVPSSQGASDSSTVSCGTVESSRGSQQKLLHTIQLIIEEKKVLMQENANLIRETHKSIIHVSSILWEFACTLEHVKLDHEEALDTEWRKHGSCRAALLSATLFVTFAILQIPIPQLLVSFVFNASKSAVYRRRFVLLNELFERLCLLPCGSEVLEKGLFEFLQEAFKKQVLEQLLLDALRLATPEYSTSHNTNVAQVPLHNPLFPPRQRQKMAFKGLQFHGTSRRKSKEIEKCSYDKPKRQRLADIPEEGIMRIHGVFLEDKARRWVCKWVDVYGKIHRKCFSQQRYGYEMGKKLAEDYLSSLRVQLNEKVEI